MRGLRFGRLRRLASLAIYVVPAVVLLAVTLPHLDQGDYRSDTGWYSAIAVQAWRTGELWTLFAEPGHAYFNKPPLVFWIHGLFLHLFGVNLVWARLPTVLAALGSVLLTVAIARELAGRRIAMLSGVVLALSVEFFRRVREISLDMWQLLFMLLAVWLVAAGVRRAKGSLVAASGVGIGLALLCKPLMALAFFPIVAAWLVWSGQARRLGWLGASFGVALLVAAPWHVSMWLTHGGEFAAQYFGAEIVDRAAGKLADVNVGAKPWWFYLKQIIGGYWPWLICILGVVVMRFRGGELRPGIWRLSIVWFAAWLALLSIYADRRDRYALPLYPALAWMAAMWLASSGLPVLQMVRRLAVRWLAPTMAVGAIVFALLPIRVQRGPDPQWPQLFQAIRELDTEGTGEPRLWQGGFIGTRGARVYLEFGWWPRPTHNRRAERITDPPNGAVLVYHRRDGLAPGGGERVLFENATFKLTRLEADEWRPVPTPDPGG